MFFFSKWISFLKKIPRIAGCSDSTRAALCASLHASGSDDDESFDEHSQEAGPTRAETKCRSKKESEGCVKAKEESEDFWYS